MMTARPLEDPILLLRALSELMVQVLAMHMTPEALEKAAWTGRQVADQQDQLEATGVAIHSANRSHDPALARMVADLYDHARVQALEKLTGVTPPKPGHGHAYKDGSATPPAA